MTLPSRLLIPAFLAIAAALSAPAGTHWPQFRGPDSSAISQDDNPPIDFGKSKNFLWATPVPRGASSPCVWDDRIFLTAFDAGKLQTLCLRRSDGAILWRQPAPVERLEKTNNLNGLATPTPCTDGERVYALFGSYGLIAYDFDGHEQWRKPLPMGTVRHGTAASPILAGNRLIVNGDQEEMKSFLIAVDPRSGKTIWQVLRPQCFSSHTTPLYRKQAGVEEILVAGSVRLVAYDATDGSERWSVRGLEAISICPSPIAGGGMIFAMSQSMGEGKLPMFDALLQEADKNHDGQVSWIEATRIARDVFSILDTNKDGQLTRDEWNAYFDVFKQADNGLFAVSVPADSERGGLTTAHVLWRQKRGIPEATSPLYYQGRVFIIQGGGLASCFEAVTGKPLYQTKRIGVASQYFASPIAAAGRIYVASTSGVVTVLEAGDMLHVLAQNDLGEPIQATPAIADDTLYVRTAEHLFALSSKPRAEAAGDAPGPSPARKQP